MPQKCAKIPYVRGKNGGPRQISSKFKTLRNSEAKNENIKPKREIFPKERGRGRRARSQPTYTKLGRKRKRDRKKGPIDEERLDEVGYGLARWRRGQEGC